MPKQPLFRSADVWLEPERLRADARGTIWSAIAAAETR